MGCPSNIFYQTTCKVQAWGGGSKALFCRYIMDACEAREHGRDSKRKYLVEGAVMQAKEWTGTFGRCNPVEHAVTKKQRSMSALEKNRAKRRREVSRSSSSLFVCSSVVQNHLRLSHPPRLFCARKHILNPLKV
jgi:hypothetical protein